ALARRIDTDADLAARRAQWSAPAPKATRGVLAKFALLVGSAADGATTQPVSPAPRSVPSTQGVTA
ncbi:MAG: dihydroxy-acid dehydratase, partial [Dokdonella sp.]|nr:dihydroxy-acid dehydratase [Dokdonella sp.]